MVLTPKLPPGRANRKALAYTADIQRLRASGYSFEAIRQALLDEGLAVSRTTIKREAQTRPPLAPPVRQQAALPSSFAKAAPAPALPQHRSEPAEATPAPGSFAGDSRSGKEIAEAFMQGRITNPLMQQKDRP